MQQRLPSLRRVPIAFAHRGARAHAPENTLSAFRLAVEMGANGLESDVWTSADGIAVLDHDGIVKGKLKSRPLSSFSRAALPPHIPSLMDLIEELGRGHDLSLDIKAPDAVPAVAHDIAETGFPAARLWLCSPYLDVLSACIRAVPGVHAVHSTRVDRLPSTLEQHLARLPDLGVDTLNLRGPEWNGGRVALAHRFGVFAFGWDLQQEESMRAGLRMGLDGVYSDHVDMMMRVHAEETARTTETF